MMNYFLIKSSNFSMKQVNELRHLISNVMSVNLIVMIQIGKRVSIAVRDVLDIRRLNYEYESLASVYRPLKLKSRSLIGTLYPNSTNGNRVSILLNQTAISDLFANDGSEYEFSININVSILTNHIYYDFNLISASNVTIVRLSSIALAAFAVSPPQTNQVQQQLALSDEANAYLNNEYVWNNLDQLLVEIFPVSCNDNVDNTDIQFSFTQLELYASLYED